MRLAVAFALVVVVPTAAADSRIVAPGPVTALAFDGSRLAYASGRSNGDCDRVRIWNPRTGRVAKLGRTTACVETSTGTGIAALSIAGPRVLWLHYTGGNTREWSLFTATASAPRPRRLRFVARDVDAGAPIVLGEGDSQGGVVLPYAVDRRVVALRADGTRIFAWTAPERVTALGARGRMLAVALAGGRIVVHDLADGSARETAGTPAAGAVFVSGAGVVAQRGRTVELDGLGGTHVTTLPAGAILRDADGIRAVYTLGGRVKRLSLVSGFTRDVGRAAYAQLEGGTVATAVGPIVRVFAS
ncbi:MAG TPA: hypothetical protein VGQ15_15450 [Gaiellaceae bacterium]|nr:hypothetical protein [Gaiellaceae bacterium]